MPTNNAVDLKIPFPAFFAYINADTAGVTGDGTVVTVPLNRELNDETNNFDTGTYTFIADRSGKFLVAVNIGLFPVAGKTGSTVTLVTTARSYSFNMNTAGTNAMFKFATLADMTVGDTMHVICHTDGGAKTTTISGLYNYTSLSCSYIG